MGSRSAIMSLLTFADKIDPSLWDRHAEILAAMDLQGSYQSKNLRTVLAALDVLGVRSDVEAIINTAKRTDFHGRWEKLSDNPYMICDIGHNEHGLRHNFAQLSEMISAGERSKLIIVYGSVADKDVDSVIHLFPRDAVFVFTQADSHRALPAEKIEEKYLAYCSESGAQPCEYYCEPRVSDAVALACRLADSESDPIIYIGGSTYVVSEACMVVDRCF